MSTVITEDLVRGLAPERPSSGHKNDFGHVLITAGSRYMTGALILSTEAALRSGAGLVTAFSTKEALMPLKANCPCALTSAWAEDVTETLRRASALIKKADAVAIGPGLDENDLRSKALVEMYLAEAPVLLLDAGALNILSRYKEEMLPLLASRNGKGLKPAVLTPHVGEAMRLMGDVNEDKCAEFASVNHCLLVLKNNKTMIFTPHLSCYSIQGDNSGLAKGGSGDVLTGLTAGLLSQGMKPCDAAVSAVYLHSKAGEYAASYMGVRAMLPTDVIDELSEAFLETGW